MKLRILKGQLNPELASMLTGKVVSIDDLNKSIFKLSEGTDRDIETLKRVGVVCEKVSD